MSAGPAAGGESGTARAMWRALETLHMTVYWTPECHEAYRRAGLRGGWMGYFASRSAAMGPVPAEVVMATFYNFHPRMVRRAIPDAWGFAPPAEVLAARFEGIDATLRRLLGGWVDRREAAEAATLTRQAMEGQDPSGRPLFAAHATLPWPEPPHLALWHAATLYREFRGDAHVACLTVDGSTAAKPTSSPPAPASSQGRSCASTAAGRRRSGPPRLVGYGIAGGSTRTVRSPRRAGRVATPASTHRRPLDGSLAPARRGRLHPPPRAARRAGSPCRRGRGSAVPEPRRSSGTVGLTECCGARGCWRG